MDNKKDLLNDLKIDRSEDNKSESSLSTKLLIIAGVVILLLTLELMINPFLFPF